MAILKVRDSEGKVYDIPALRGPKGSKGDKGDKGDTADGSLFANAVKGNLKGEIVQANDVSPVEHIVNVKVDHTDPMSVIVTRYGKNLYDSTMEIICNGAYNSAFVTDKNSKWYGKIDINTLPDLFSISTRVYCEDYGRIQSSDTSLRIYYYDSNKEQISNKMGSNATAEKPYTAIIFDKSVVPSGTKYIELIIRINSTGYTVNSQIEVGSTATNFEEYKGAEHYTPDADGIVEITSVSPTMTLLTNTAGVVINCEYNRDLNVVISNIAKLLGSEV